MRCVPSPFRALLATYTRALPFQAMDGRMGYGELVALLRTTNKFASVLSAIFSLVFTAAQGYASVSLTGRGDGSDKQGTTVRRPGPRLTSNFPLPPPTPGPQNR